MFLYVLLKLSDMSGSAVCVDVDTIRIIADHMRLRTEGVKYVLCDGKGASIGAVKSHPHIFEGACGN